MFEELWKIIQAHYAAKRYHLVLGNIQLLIPLFKPHLLDDPAALQIILTSLQDMFVQLDALAAEFHFRDYLHRYYIQPLYQQIKLFDEPLAESFLQTLMKRIPRSDRGKIRYAKYEHTFQTFYNLEDKDPDKQLRLARGQRIALLEANMADNQYGVWSDVVLSYVDAQLCAGQGINAIQLKAVLNCLDALLTRINTVHPNEVVVEELWHEVLIAQRLLSNHLAQASIGEDLSCEVLSNWWQAHQSQAAGLFLLPVIAQAIALHKKGNCDTWYALAQQINAQLMTYVPLNLTTVFANHALELQTIRDVFEKLLPAFSLMTPQALVKAQQQFTQDTLNLLNRFVQMVASLLGDAPCDFALCALGSTSREDRRPYSDVELVLLYRPKPNVNAAQLQTYLYYLVCGVELVIKQCGESHKENADPSLQQSAGFHLDDSSHLLKKKLVGTPEEIAHKFIVNIAQSWEEEGHPWLNDESFYSLLSPVLINTNHYGGKPVLGDYKALIQNYLNEVGSAVDQIPTLVQSLNLTAPLNFNGLKRREVIALSCLYDVAQKSKSVLTSLTSGEVVDDIKRAFYKPLTYLALNLKLFYGVSAEHPAEIFAEAASHLSWGERGIVKLLQIALSYITNIQIKLHLQHGHQEERIVWLGIVNDQVDNRNTQISSLSAEEYVGLSLIKDGLLLPLSQWLELQFKTQSSSFKLTELLPFLIRSYLAKRNEPWLRKWTDHPSHPLKLNELLAHPLISVLADYPSPNGWSPTYEQAMRCWMSQLHTLMTSDKTTCLIEGIPTGQQKACYLPQEIVAQLFDTQGEFKGNVHHLAHSKVSQVSWPAEQANTKTFYFKVKPGNEAGLMGREFAVIDLHQLLGGQSHIALGWPLKLTYFTAKGAKLYYCWVSEGIPGKSLAEVMQDETGFADFQTQVDMQSYSHLFVTHYLTCPEDGQPENFKVMSSSNATNPILVGFDVGQSFVGTYDEAHKVLTVKSMLYLLEGPIQKPLDIAVLTRLLLLEPQAIMAHWQANLERMNQLFRPLWVKPNQLIDLNQEVKRCVQSRLELLLNWLYGYPTQFKSGMRLLKMLDKAVAFHYQSLLGKVKTPEDFKNKIDPKAYVKNPSTGKMCSSSTYQQIQQRTLTPERLQVSLNLNESYFAAIDFRKIKEEAEQRYVLALLQASVQHKQRFAYLNLSGCTVLSETALLALLQKLPSLKELYLEDCPQFNLLTVFQLLSFKVSERIAGFFRWEYDVLCPYLKQLSITLEDDTHLMDIALTVASRKQLVALMTQKQKQLEFYLKMLLIMLRDKDTDVQIVAAQNLGQLSASLSAVQAKKLVERLLGRLGNKYTYTRKMMALNLLKLAVHLSAAQVQRVVTALLDLLDFETAQSLVKFAVHLSAAQVERLIERLLNWLGDENCDVRMEAAQNLALLAASLSTAQLQQVFTALLDRLGDKDWNVRKLMAQSLVKLSAQLSAAQAEQLIEELLNRLGDKKNWPELMAQSLIELSAQLSAAQAEKLIKALLNRLGDKDVRKWVAQSLVGLSAQLSAAQVEQLIEALLNQLRDQDEIVQTMAVVRLEELAVLLSNEQVAAVVNALLDGLKDLKWFVQAAVVKILGELAVRLSAVQVQQVVAALLDWLGDKDWPELAAQSLVKLSAQLSAEQIQRVVAVLLDRGSEDWFLRSAVAESLVKLSVQLSAAQAEKVIEKLLDWLSDSNVRESVAQRLVELSAQLSAAQAEKLIEKLLDRLCNEDKDIRELKVVAESLVKLSAQLSAAQAKKLIERLLDQLGNENCNVGMAAAKNLTLLAASLSMAQLQQVVAALLDRLGDKDWNVRKLVAQSLVKLSAQLLAAQAEQLIEKLLNLLGDKDWNVLELVAQSLVKFSAQLSAAQAEKLIEMLPTWLENETFYVDKVYARQSLILLASQLSAAQLHRVVERLLDLMGNSKNFYVRKLAVDSLAELFSSAFSLQWLQRNLREANENAFGNLSRMSTPAHQEILFKTFFFLDQKALLQVVPQVHRDWGRWQKVYVQQQAEKMRTQSGFIEKEGSDSDLEGKLEYDLNRFLPK